MVKEKNAAVRQYPGESINAKRLGQTSFASGGAFSSWLPTLSTSVFFFEYRQQPLHQEFQPWRYYYRPPDPQIVRIGH
jgi:hypothetical protein